MLLWRPIGFLVGQSLRGFSRQQQRHVIEWCPSRHHIGSYLSTTNLIRTTICKSSLNHLDPDPSDSNNSQQGFTEEDLDRWERMYYEGERKQQQTTDVIDIAQDGREDETTATNTLSCAIRVISFDLDNTLWKTSATIGAANNALASFLDEHGIVQTKRVEVVMGELFANHKARYCPIDANRAKAPVLLTLLRKDAIRWVLEQEENGYSTPDAEAFADQAFDTWVAARHEAVVPHLAEKVVETLSTLSTMQTPPNGDPIQICAITDGNSNPDLVECLSGFFDFVVNAEEIGIAKPDKRIYLKAAHRILISSSSSINDGNVVVDRRSTLQQEEETIVSVSDNHEDGLEDRIGPWWVHVGDDFVKDIVAAKGLNMRTVWVKELVQGKVQKVDASTLALSSSTERTVEDLVKDVSEEKVVEMGVGTDDYLAQTLQDEFADAVVDKFSDLSKVIMNWQQEALETTESSTSLNTYSDTRRRTGLATENIPQRQPNVAMPMSSKFCMFCGESILKQARFCSSCGKSQEPQAAETDR